MESGRKRSPKNSMAAPDTLQNPGASDNSNAAVAAPLPPVALAIDGRGRVTSSHRTVGDENKRVSKENRVDVPIDDWLHGPKVHEDP